MHRLATRHTKQLRGQTVRVSSPQGRFVDAALVDGQVFRSAEAFGKHLFHDYTNGLSVHVHLGIYGEFHERDGLVEPKPTTRMRVVTRSVSRSSSRTIASRSSVSWPKVSLAPMDLSGSPR